jgi:hypothetical protein
MNDQDPLVTIIVTSLGLFCLFLWFMNRRH